jgi:dipeptidyl aminopeptidase/acylaminoacyl peptidase
MTWSPDASRLFFTAEDRGREAIYTVAATGGGIRIVVQGDAHHGDVQLAPEGRSMIFTGNSGSHPVEIFHGFSSGGQPVQLTHLNDDVMKEFALVPLDEVSYQSTDGTRIEGLVVRPPDFDRTRKYPLLVLIHGGPQGAWGESWSYRWNPQVFAAAGYVVFMPNPRGSTGYGQSFIDGINGEWGGLVFDDIMSGVDSMVRQPYIDSQRLVAAGASYGGYMINWMLGHTNRFRAFVSHDGVYDLRSMFGSTEEMWFPLWEFDGAPWENPEMYEKWSPSNFVEKFQTPTLIVHGEKDYRVPVSQAMQLFTALQLRKVPSKFLYFPDEGHWVLKPRNSVHWYQSVIDWLNEWTSRPWTPPADAPSYRRPAPPPPFQAPAPTGSTTPTVSR